MSQPPDAKSLDLYGMPVKISDFFPDNLIGINTGDKLMAIDSAPAGDKMALIEFKTQHRWVPMSEPLPDDALAEVYADAVSRRMQEAWYKLCLGDFTTNTRTEPMAPLTFDKLEKIMTEFEEQTLELDRKLVSALLGAGIDVQVTSRETRPLATLPPRFRQAAAEVAEAERVRPADFGESAYSTRGRIYL